MNTIGLLPSGVALAVLLEVRLSLALSGYDCDSLVWGPYWEAWYYDR